MQECQECLALKPVVDQNPIMAVPILERPASWIDGRTRNPSRKARVRDANQPDASPRGNTHQFKVHAEQLTGPHKTMITAN